MKSVSPFLRNLAILAAIAALIVVLNQETALATASQILRLAFFIAIAVVAYLLWRDFGRREISTWPGRAQAVFYGAIALLVIDFGWWEVATLNGRDVLAFFAVIAVCVYVAVRTWRDRQRLS
jgi:hypothetical protein